MTAAETTDIDFHSMAWFAARAAAAYKSPDEIRSDFPNTIHVETCDDDVQYFLEVDEDKKQQVICVRGTCNLANVKEDIDYIEAKDPRLGIRVHKGFDCASGKIFELIKPLLDREMDVIVTGHSLGAAIAALLAIYLHEEGFRIGPSMNFGQPKFTNKHGVTKYEFLPIMRIVDENDVVPLVPPEDLIDLLHGGYEHLWPEVVLLEKEYYSYLDAHNASRTSVGEFWRNIGSESVKAHFMENYIKNIQSKFDRATLVPFTERKHYYDL